MQKDIVLSYIILYYIVCVASYIHVAYTGVNQRPKVYLYSGPTSKFIISLPGQPYHVIDFGPSEVRATSGQHLGGHYFRY